MNTDTAEPGERAARALDEENTGTTQERIRALTGRAQVTPPGYMTPMQFAALSSDVHHAVWAAYNAGLLDTYPPKDINTSAPRRYRRDQVQAIQLALTSPPPQEAQHLTLVTP
jgi:hypothetical protein